jgi:hypothetical protein
MKKAIQHKYTQDGKKYVTVFQDEGEICIGCAFNGSSCNQKIATEQCLRSGNKDGLKRIWKLIGPVVHQPKLKVWVTEIFIENKWVITGTSLTRKSSRSHSVIVPGYKLRIRKYVPEIKPEV